MNVKKFVARTSRDALNLVRQALGADAVVLSTKPCEGGVEILAMGPEGMQSIERLAASSKPSVEVAPSHKEALPTRAAPARKAVPVAPVSTAQDVNEDVARLSMSTLSFQDYVRDRMIKRRQAVQRAQERQQEPSFSAEEREVNMPSALGQRLAARNAAPALAIVSSSNSHARSSVSRDPPILHEAVDARSAAGQNVSSLTDATSSANLAAARREQQEMMVELRSVKGLIEERFSALAFMEKLQRHPVQAQLIQKLLDCGFSPALIRKLTDGMPSDVGDEIAWAASVLERNLTTGEAEAGLEDQGGVFALIGATGVGKTTTAAKIAAAFATKHGAGNLGLITLDAYRLAAHEQLRAYGRILGVPVYTAHDRASLEDLLELLASKKMVLIDTAGMAQRDTRTSDLLDMLAHRSIHKLLVVNAGSQGETIEDVLTAYRASTCKGIVLSKLDEAVKLAPALDALIRHKLKVVGVANGQRVPEDWHRLSAHALVHRAVRATTAQAYRIDAEDVNLIFTARQQVQRAHPPLHA